MLLTNETKTHFLSDFRTGLEKVFHSSFYLHTLSEQCVFLNTYEKRTNTIEEIVESKAAFCLFFLEEGLKVIELHTTKSFAPCKYEHFLKNLCAPYFGEKEAFLFFYAPAHSFFHFFGEESKKENMNSFLDTIKQEFKVYPATNFSLQAFLEGEYEFLQDFSRSLFKLEYSSHIIPLYMCYEKRFTHASFGFWIEDTFVPFYEGALSEDILTHFKAQKIKEEDLLKTEEELISYANDYLSFEKREHLQCSYSQKTYLFDIKPLFSFIRYYIAGEQVRYSVYFQGELFESTSLSAIENFVKGKLDALFKPRRLRFLFQQKKEEL